MGWWEHLHPTEAPPEVAAEPAEETEAQVLLRLPNQRTQAGDIERAAVLFCLEQAEPGWFWPNDLMPALLHWWQLGAGARRRVGTIVSFQLQALYNKGLVEHFPEQGWRWTLLGWAEMQRQAFGADSYEQQRVAFREAVESDRAVRDTFFAAAERRRRDLDAVQRRDAGA